MKKLKILSILIVASGIGCSDQKLPKGADQIMFVDSSRSVPRQTITYSDPSLFGGCSFGNAFLAFLRVQDYASCLKYTSKGSIRKYGTAAILKLYKGLKINYKLHLRSVIKSPGDTTIMRYTANEYATSKFKEFKLIVENDTCRLVIDKPEEFLK